MKYRVTVGILALALSIAPSRWNSPLAEGLQIDIPDKFASPSTNAHDKSADGGRSTQDSASAADDLETARAAVDRSSTPSVSLGVSGWASQQVIKARRKKQQRSRLAQGARPPSREGKVGPPCQGVLRLEHDKPTHRSCSAE